MSMQRADESNRNVSSQCIYHVVWCPRVSAQSPHQWERRAIKIDCARSMYGISLQQRRIGSDPQLGLHRLVKLLKGRSSRLLRQEYPSLRSRLPTLWTNSSFVSTLGGAPFALITRSIEEQKHV